MYALSLATDLPIEGGDLTRELLLRCGMTEEQIARYMHVPTLEPDYVIPLATEGCRLEEARLYSLQHQNVAFCFKNSVARIFTETATPAQYSVVQSKEIASILTQISSIDDNNQGELFDRLAKLRFYQGRLYKVLGD